MSKQSEAKTSQGYEPKPRLHVCMNCGRFASDIVNINAGRVDYLGQDRVPYFEEKNLRCTVGGFAVKKMGSCRIFVMAEAK